MNDCLAVSTWLIVAFMVGIGAASFGLAFWLSHRMKAKPAPRDQRKFLRYLAWFWIAILLFQLFMIVLEGRKLEPERIVFLACWAVPIAIYLYQFHRQRSDEEIQKNYAYDQQRCGRCDYDLTGNTTGICSECGWEIPTEPVRLVDPNWIKWWRQWDIEYLDRPRSRLIGLLFAVVTLWVFAGVFLYRWNAVGSYLFCVFAVLLSAQATITAVRIYQYRRRERAKENAVSEESESTCQQGTD